VDGGRSQSASRAIGQRKLLRSLATRITTSRNCHTNPALSAAMSTWVNRRALGAGPASAGATSQASAPIGSAAATHTASTVRREYCSIEESVLVDAVLTEDPTIISWLPSVIAPRSAPRGPHPTGAAADKRRARIAIAIRFITSLSQIDDQSDW
jgi:hypothetical protein